MRGIAALVLLALSLVPAHAQMRIAGTTNYPPHSLVRLKAEGVDPKSGVLWRVYPSAGVQRATNPRGVFEFAAPPGTYEVELLAVTAGADGELRIDEAHQAVTIGPGTPDPKPTPPTPPAPPPGEGKLDAVNALGKIRFGNAGCTATVVGPRRPDGRWDVLTAAHCVSSEGQRGTMTLKDGRTIGIRVVAHHKTPDLCWCVTEDVIPDLSYALLAAKNPEVGTAVWHMGYGVDRPGNREDGTISDRENGDGQLRMTLSVSSGDSGGRHLPRRHQRTRLGRLLHERHGPQGLDVGRFDGGGAAHAAQVDRGRGGDAHADPDPRRTDRRGRLETAADSDPPGLPPLLELTERPSMQTFTDNAGRTWAITIHVTAVKRVRGLVDVDLYKLVDDGFKPLAALVADPVRLADVLYCLCRDEATARNVSDEDFGRSLAGDAIVRAADAFVEELIDFFPEARARAGLRKVVSAGKTVQVRMLDHAERVLAAIDPEQIAAREIERLRESASRTSFGNSPGSSASTPGPSPSANS